MGNRSVCGKLGATLARRLYFARASKIPQSLAGANLNRMKSADFVRWFRDSTPYISAHRRKTFVAMLDADAIASDNLVNTVHDLALLHVLGARLAIVHGAVAPQPAASLADMLGAIGAARSRLEALFSTGIPSSPLRGSRITLLSGNLVTAKPLGVIGGKERGHAGAPRRIHAQEIGKLLDQDAIALLPPLGYSPSGAAYALAPEALAADVAIALSADKLIVYDAIGRVRQASEMTPAELAAALAEDRCEPTTASRLQAMLRASRAGVPRCHLISWRTDGALLQELFTAEGVGTQVSEQDYRVMRPATAADVASIVELIRPLEESGHLTRRPRDRLEAEIERFAVAELDGIVIGCCSLHPHGRAVELACVATHPGHRYRVGGKTLGARMLAYAEEVAAQAGFERMFVLTTRSEEWFSERGFQPSTLADLPASRQALYNYQRNSKVMQKLLATTRPAAAAAGVGGAALGGNPQ